VNTYFRVRRFEGAEESDRREWIGDTPVNTEVRPSLTISGFSGLANRKPCSEIREIMRCEVSKG
jgi:hypothetical protein